MLPTFEDVMSCETALFEWADSFDSKDWDRLKKCIAPTLSIDYSSIMSRSWDAMEADEFVSMASNPHFLGNIRIKTQHFIGASKWQQVADSEITGKHQIRVAHQRHSDDACTDVTVKGHAHGTATVTYRKVDGIWKFAGLVPNKRWAEFEYDKMFLPNEAVDAPGANDA